MNKYIKDNISLILRIFLYLQPVIDLVTGIMINYLNINITIGMIIRFLFLLFIIYFYIFVKKNNSKYKIVYLIITFIYAIISTTLIIINKDIYVLNFELSNILKVFYLPVLITLVDKDDIKISIKDIVYVGIIYLSLISFANVFNISYNSYTQGKIGSVGLFNSGNEISAILSIITPFIIYYLFNKNNSYIKVLLIILMAYNYFTIGSKIIIISLILSIIFNLYIYFKNNKVETKKIVLGSIIAVLIAIICIYLIPKTNFYYNIKLHLNFLGINHFSNLFTYNFINRFIFSDRITFLTNIHNIFMEANILSKLFGVGFITNYATDLASTKLIEMDLFDIFYRVGIVGFIVFIIPIIKGIKDVFNKKNSIVIFSIILAFIISTLVGHTLIAPSVSILLLYVLKYNKR